MAANNHPASLRCSGAVRVALVLAVIALVCLTSLDFWKTAIFFAVAWGILWLTLELLPPYERRIPPGTWTMVDETSWKMAYRITHARSKGGAGGAQTEMVIHCGSPGGEFVVKEFTAQECREFVIRRDLLLTNQTTTSSESVRVEVAYVRAGIADFSLSPQPLIGDRAALPDHPNRPRSPDRQPSLPFTLAL